MKQKIILIAVAIFSIFAYQSIKAQSKFDKWAELKNFHEVMSQTFHPSEDGNLKPIKTRSAEIVEKAELLAKSTIPAEFNNSNVKEVTQELVKQSKALDAMIKKEATDAEIKKALSSLHDVFHQIVERCSKNSEKH